MSESRALDATEADFERRRLLANEPSRVKLSLRARLAPLMPEPYWEAFQTEFHALRQTRFAELGLWWPHAASRSFADGSALVVIHDGLVAFLEAVTRTLAAGGRHRTPSGEGSSSVLEPDDVDQGLLALYRQWQQLWGDQSLVVRPLDLPPGLASIAEGMCTAAVFFFLMHEYAHAVLHPGLSAVDHTPDHELAADAWAIQQIMQRSGSPLGRQRSLLGGSVLAIRTWQALEVMGCHFPGKYPPPETRLAKLVQTFDDLCDSDFTYYYFSTIAYAHDERMEAVERALRGLPYLPRSAADRIVSRMMSMLIEVCARRMTLLEAADVVGHDLGRADAAVLEAVGRIAGRVFDRTRLDAKDTSSTLVKGAIIDKFDALLGCIPENRLQYFNRTSHENATLP